ncbi:hypothetical protein BJ165DRAFT_1515535, partial [Panaeolus papilionaceus]
MCNGYQPCLPPAPCAPYISKARGHHFPSGSHEPYIVGPSTRKMPLYPSHLIWNNAIN